LKFVIEIPRYLL